MSLHARGEIEQKIRRSRGGLRLPRPQFWNDVQLRKMGLELDCFRQNPPQFVIILRQAQFSRC